MDLKELESGVYPQTHWYYQTKKIRLLKFFKERVVILDRKVTVIDIGAGSGFFSLELYKLYPQNINKVILVDLYYTEDEIEQTKGHLIQKTRELPSMIQDSLIIMMDVLEHIEDDRNFLCQLKQKVATRNYVFITVPAFQQLWSAHDVFLGHYRRYTRNQINNLLKNSGFTIKRSYYQYGLIFPLAYLMRKLQGKSTKSKNDMKPANVIVNTLLQTIISIEMQLTHFNQAFGLTCTVEGYLE